jgi:hypothetical protein
MDVSVHGYIDMQNIGKKNYVLSGLVPCCCMENVSHGLCRRLQSSICHLKPPEAVGQLEDIALPLLRVSKVMHETGQRMVLICF